MQKSSKLFSGRKMVIATMHKKEMIIGPLVASRLGVIPFVPKNLDTDQFGTFSGEKERTSDPLTAARAKCELAMELTNCDLAVASEGSFSTHPDSIFIPANEELVILLDKKNGLEIIGSTISTTINFNGRICKTLEQLLDFASYIGFPEQGLILKDRKKEFNEIVKGIMGKQHLINEFNRLIAVFAELYAETDLRAMYNPTRMLVIGQATQSFLDRIATTCINCNMPGFGVTDVVRGLPCGDCSYPTSSIKIYIHSCKKCGYRENKLGEDQQEDAKFCDNCNH